MNLHSCAGTLNGLVPRVDLGGEWFLAEQSCGEREDPALFRHGSRERILEAVVPQQPRWSTALIVMLKKRTTEVLSLVHFAWMLGLELFANYWVFH